ncbi:hypothetical protein GGR53DRAFT_287794 [Hypoxylon sp. FL1150]|nr:hypothetical protein GGR53DRAFT_287794 [Hypoxylon sp. FL1150]
MDIQLQDLIYLDELDDEGRSYDEPGEVVHPHPDLPGMAEITEPTIPVLSEEPPFDLDELELYGASYLDGTTLDIVNSRKENLDATGLIIDDFFKNNGAWRPVEPCSYCKRLRLQCFMLQTTLANPNPRTSCSSCVALFRQCSLAERGKRQHAEFETLQPVINNLHGVNEELEVGDDSACFPSKRTQSRTTRRTQPLKVWFGSHLDNPYPSEEEKVFLAGESGLSRTQVTDWFTNARRRHRLSYKAVNKKIFPHGSPMPASPMSDMTPFERWRHSPPEEEPISVEFGKLQDICSSTSLSNPSSSNSNGGSALNTLPSWEPHSSDSASSCHTYSSAESLSVFSASLESSLSHKSSSSNSNSIPSPPRTRNFQCSYCPRKFAKKYDWRRHERSVHRLSTSTRWVCAVPLPAGQSSLIWRPNQREPECVFCGRASPTEDHFQSHEFEACAERPLPDRTFARKDHLWQHLSKFHSCRKWEGWKPELNLLRHT